MDFSLTLIIFFSVERIFLQTKYQNYLKTETVDKLWRVSLNSGSVDKVKATEFFIAKIDKDF